MAKYNNVPPDKAAKFLEQHGWTSVNREGTHETFHKKEDDKNYFCQIIRNNKTIRWKNFNLLIKKSRIPKAEWEKWIKNKYKL